MGALGRGRDETLGFIDKLWEAEILPTLCDYIKIPNKSPHFDAAWREHGHMERAVSLVESWCRRQPVPGLTVEVVRLEGRTPVILLEKPGRGDDTVLLYGHLDKQPEMTGWRAGLGPWIPVREGDRLYGRGSADDGYAAFAALSALRTLSEQGREHARAVVLIEACEESGSPDLPFYIEALAARIGRPSLVVCLDSGCGDYERLWSTTSLRGIVVGSLKVEVLSEGVHSGDAGGIVADTFRIARQLLSRLEDAATGRIIPADLHVEIPKPRAEEARATAAVVGAGYARRFPFVPGASPEPGELAELLLNRAWRPALAVTGADGLPAIKDAGNVLRPETSLKLSLRLPPRLDAHRAGRSVEELLTRNPPGGARVSFEWEGADGWDAPALAPWLDQATAAASQEYFGQPAATMGEGGSIPFMHMLGERFPEAQFLITGLLGPEANAHGPNEFLHIPSAKRLTACVASVLSAHASR